MNKDISVDYKNMLIEIGKLLDILEENNFDMLKLQGEVNNCKVKNNVDSKRTKHKN